MVGLSVVQETQQGTTTTASDGNKKSAPVISKIITINKPPTPPSSPSFTPFKSPFPRLSFLDQCFLCETALLPTEDIYMYQGDKAFCTLECRFRQILVDEEDEMKMMTKTATPTKKRGRDKCSFAATRPPATPPRCARKSRYN